MALTEEEKAERSQYLEENLRITRFNDGLKYCFVSYASADWRTVFKEAIVPLQKKYGLRVYADKAFESRNEKWVYQMCDNIGKAGAMIAFISQNYIESYACLLELLTALPNKELDIVFVFLDSNLTDNTKLTDIISIDTKEKRRLNAQINEIKKCSVDESDSSVLKNMDSGLNDSQISERLADDSLTKYHISKVFINFLKKEQPQKMKIENLFKIFDPQNGQHKDLCDQCGAVPSTVQPVPREAVPVVQAAPAAESVTDKEYSYTVNENSEHPIELSGKYTGDREDGCPNGQGTMNYPNGDIYKGDWKDGRPNGQGKFLCLNGSSYEGFWKDGKRDGQGTMIYPNGDFYKGDWKDDRRNGQGTQNYITGNFYEGTWKDGKQNGHCKFTWTNSDVYEGDWKDGEPNGYGTKKYKAKNRPDFYAVYSGEWRNGKPNGYGAKSYSNGKIYIGEWENSLFHGQGKYSLGNGDVFYGNWQNGNAVEYGIITFSDGAVYVGGCKQFKPDGIGIMRYHNGDIRVGEWLNGEPVGDALPTIYYPEKNYTGQAENGLPNGFGVMKGKGNNHWEYIGELINGKPSGKGVMFYSGRTYRAYFGNWEDGRRCGNGIAEYTNDDLYIGEWDKGITSGIVKYADGSVYSGEFTIDPRFGLSKRGGQGKLINADGTIQEGRWEDDNFVG